MLILAQAGLGGATVEENLDEVLVAAHLGLAMLLLGGLLYLWRGCGRRRARRAAGRACWRSAASVAVFCTIVAGGYMAGTQKYGRPDYQLGDGAHHACGKQFPTCNGDFMPFGQSRLVDIHLTHRAFMYLASVLLIALIVVSLRRRVAVPYALGLAGAAGDADPGRRAERLAGRVRVADRRCTSRSARCCGRRRWRLTLQLAPARERARGRAEAVAA